jgi:acetyl esterase/lipase
VILYLHGGAYTMGSCATHRSLAARIAAAGRSATLQPEYRLAPEHPSPAALEECTAAYRHLLDGGTPPAQIAVVGDSAGGGLALALAVGLRDAGIPLPAALVYLSPWTDLAMTGESVRTRATVDPVCTVTESALHAAHYAGCAAARAPRVSPVYADLHGLPPLLLHVGDLEILLSDATRVADRARAAGVDVTLQVCPGMWHVWHLLAAWVPEARSGRSARSSTNT